MALVIDALVITVAIFLIFRGAKRGLILSLGGFVALLIAFFGARYAVARFAPPVSEFLSGYLERSIAEQLSKLELPAGEELTALLQALPEIVRKYLLTEQTSTEIAMQVSSLLDGLKEDLVAAAARETANLIAEVAAELVISVVSFVALLIGCHLIVRLLDAVCHLPLLRDANALLGAVFGGAHAALLLMIFAWIVGKFHVPVSPELLGQTTVLRFLVELIQ